MFVLRVAKRLLSIGIVLIAIATVAAATVTTIGPQVGTIASAHEGTAADLQLDTLAERSAMYAADGTFLTLLTDEENREPMDLKDVPQTVIDAILAIEDADFYEHDGINQRGTIRALVENVEAGGIEQGGSTITQQLVKNAILTDEQSLNRKATEAFYALRLERQMTKDEILERYLNTVYFGSGAYGVKAAAETYWGYEDPAELDWAEAALMAGVIRNPTQNDPTRFPSVAKKRRSIVLNRLVGLGHITEEEAEIFELAPVPAERQEPLPTKPTDYFIEEALQTLLRDPRILGNDKEYRKNVIYRGGLKIYTSLDPAAQASALEARDNVLPSEEGLPESQRGFTAAIATVETHTGAVRALVGGPEFEKEKFNLATQGLRQPGSSMKTFVLAALFENGYTPRDVVRADGPCSFDVPGQRKPYTVGGSFRGRQDIGAVTRSSNNCAFVRLGQVVDNEQVARVSKRLGISTLLPEAGEFLSLPLGTNEVHPMEMAAAYAAIGNDGLYNEPWYIERIEDRDGLVVYERRPNPSRAINVEPARMITEVLASNVQRGTGKRARVAGHDAAGKTGTTNDSTNAWFVGYTDYYSTAVWLGDPNLERKIRLPGYQRGVFGGEIPSKIWGEYNIAIHEDLEPRDFQPPERYGGGRYLKVAGEIDFCDEANFEGVTNGTELIDSNGNGRLDCFRPITTVEESTTTTETFPQTQPTVPPPESTAPATTTFEEEQFPDQGNG